MRAFVILCLVAVACADNMGYNYQPVGHTDSGFSFAPGAGDSFSSFNGEPSYVGEQPFSNVSPQGETFVPQTEFDKKFFTYTANEEDFSDPADNNKYDNAVNKGLHVVFIKGPENNGLENAALNLAKQAADKKTDIFVLNKQADLDSLSNKLNTLNKNNNNNNKPEVHFVKYRSSEEAANAQNVIQGQYDSLGGSSQSVDGGIAPVLNFASMAPNAGPVSSYIPPAAGPSANYLPANILRS